MVRRVGNWMVAGLLMAMAWTPALQGQDAPWRPSTEGQPAVRPDQPVQPQLPTVQRRQPPAAPFVLSPEQQAQVDQVLLAWEQRCAKIKMFECTFARYEYDAVFGDGTSPKHVDQGNLKYGAPDRGLFRVEKPREEQWICDGRAIYEYKYEDKTIRKYPLPPELQGKAISNGPLPFLFGANAQHLKQRYFIRLITPPDAQGQVWLEAYPRFQQDAANFSKADLILTSRDMLPFALQLYQPGGKNRTVYRFANITLNNPLRILNDPFRVSEPAWSDWEIVVEQPQAPAQASRAPAAGRQ